MCCLQIRWSYFYKKLFSIAISFKRKYFCIPSIVCILMLILHRNDNNVDFKCSLEKNDKNNSQENIVKKLKRTKNIETRKSQSSLVLNSLGGARTLSKFAFLIQFLSVSTAYTSCPFAKTESVEPPIGKSCSNLFLRLKHKHALRRCLCAKRRRNYFPYRIHLKTIWVCFCTA